jgi:hypothetical protein
VVHQNHESEKFSDFDCGGVHRIWNIEVPLGKMRKSPELPAQNSDLRAPSEARRRR